MLHRERAGWWLAAVMVIAMSLHLGKAAAAENMPVDLELVLAVDISLSMDEDEQRLQRDGYAHGLPQPRNHRGDQDRPTWRIAVTYVEWSGESFQRIVIPWTLIDGAETALPFADKLAAAPIEHELSDFDLGSVDLCQGTVRRQWLSWP